MRGHEQTRGTGNQISGVNLEELEDSVLLGAKIMETSRHQGMQAEVQQTRASKGAVLVWAIERPIVTDRSASR